MAPGSGAPPCSPTTSVARRGRPPPAASAGEKEDLLMRSESAAWTFCETMRGMALVLRRAI